MIFSEDYTIITNDPDNFRIRYARQEETDWNDLFPHLFLKAFEETLKAHSDMVFVLLQFNLEVFEKAPIRADLYSESMVYHLEPSFVKLHGYLYSKENSMICQASAHYLMPI